MIAAEKLPATLYSVWGPQWAFLGYGSAVLLGVLRLQASVWSTLQNVSFWLHFILVTTLLLLLPFSRFFHVIISPVIVAYNTMRAQEAQIRFASAGHGVPKPTT